MGALDPTSGASSEDVGTVSVPVEIGDDLARVDDIVRRIVGFEDRCRPSVVVAGSRGVRETRVADAAGEDRRFLVFGIPMRDLLPGCSPLALAVRAVADAVCASLPSRSPDSLHVSTVSVILLSLECEGRAPVLNAALRDWARSRLGMRFRPVWSARTIRALERGDGWDGAFAAGFERTARGFRPIGLPATRTALGEAAREFQAGCCLSMVRAMGNA